MKKLFATILAAAAMILIPTAAHAYDSKTVVKGEVTCGTQICTQYKWVTYYTHGEDPVTVTYVRYAPVESRTDDRTLDWTDWQVYTAGVTSAWSRHRIVSIARR